VVYGALVNDCSERGEKEQDQERDLESKKAKLLLECTEK
jgi:hypothetical protein